MNSIHEECGVFGIYSTADDDLAALTYYGLYALQHRACQADQRDQHMRFDVPLVLHFCSSSRKP